jgi:hypothetical protein
VCDDHPAENSPAEQRPGVSRRAVLSGAVAAGVAATGAFALAGCTGQPSEPPRRSVTRDTAIDGLTAYSMATHVHSSFSEMNGSMDSQLFQATKNSVDVLWWTEHDQRMLGLDYAQTVNFTSLAGAPGRPARTGLTDGAAWLWQPRSKGPLARTSRGGLVSSPVSPNDPARQGSLHVTAKSSGTGPASSGYYADSQPAGWNYRDNLTGQTLRIDVLLTPGWRDGHLELLISSSYHQATGGRPAGPYALSYRFVPAGTAARRAAHGNTGVITIPVAPSAGSRWYQAVLTPTDDIAALWPDVDHRDFALYGLTLSAVSTGEEVAGYFGNLRFDRAKSGEALLRQQIDMSANLAPKYPKVHQRQGLEVSWKLPHMNWFGESIKIVSYQGIQPHEYAEFVGHTVVPEIHRAGGLVSYNHPFGYSFHQKLRPKFEQNLALKHVAAKMLPTASAPAAMGADLLEVGYPNRQGIGLGHHIALWDILSRNGAFLTGLGSNDDHWGQNWYGVPNNWYTSVWAKSTAIPDLLTAMGSGRAWAASLSGYRGSMDLLVDGSAPMGSVSVSSLTSRRLTAYATDLPANGKLQVIQGDVDYAGHADAFPKRRVIGHYAPSDFASGAVTQTIDTSKASFVRTQVLNANGKVVALSNPVWLLRSAPPGGIPTRRGA